jgi:hypothetical protein
MKVALLIGCNYAGTSIALKGCINDALLMQSTLINRYGFLSKNIVVMRDDLPRNNALYPSYANMMTQLANWVRRSTTDATMLYFHYSGHGSSVVDSNADESDGRDEVIIPSDYPTLRRFISDDQLYSVLNGLKNTIPVFMSFDNCNSGTVLDLPLSYYYDTTTKKFTQKAENRNTNLQSKNICCISACMDSQFSLDVSGVGTPNGAFTMALVNTLSRYSFVNVPIATLISGIFVYLLNNKYTGMSPVVSLNKNLDLTQLQYLVSFTNLGVVSSSAQTTIRSFLLEQLNSKTITKQEIISIVNTL